MAEFNIHISSCLLFDQHQSKINRHPTSNIWHYYNERGHNVVNKHPKNSHYGCQYVYITCVLYKQIGELDIKLTFKEHMVMKKEENKLITNYQAYSAMRKARYTSQDFVKSAP